MFHPFYFVILIIVHYCTLIVSMSYMSYLFHANKCVVLQKLLFLSSNAYDQYRHILSSSNWGVWFQNHQGNAATVLLLSAVKKVYKETIILYNL